MEILINKVSTGDIVFFDKKTTELILIDRNSADEWEQEKDQTIETARKWATKGKAQAFSKNDLEKIQTALAGIPLHA